MRSEPCSRIRPVPSLTPSQAARRPLSRLLALGAVLSIAAWTGVAAHATTVVCQGDTPPPFYKYEVRPDPGESISFFRVETEDRNAADGSYANFIQPSGWPDPKVSDGYVTWTCDQTASNCPLPSGSHTFGFTNDHPARLGDWETNAPDSSSSHSGDCIGGKVWIPKKRDLGGGGPGPGGPGPGGPMPGGPGPGGNGRIYIDIVFQISDPGGMQLSSFFLTHNGDKIPGSDIGPQVMPQGTSTFKLCLPSKPNDAHLKYAWFDKPGKPGDPDDPKDPDPSPDLKLLQLAVSTVPTTCHDIDPFKLGVWYPLICKRTKALFLLDQGDGARFCFEPFELQARGRAHCPSPRLPVEGRDLKFDGLAQNGYGFTVDQAADSDADGHPDFADNCFSLPNPNQSDADADGLGDRCDAQPYEDLDGFCPCDGPLVEQTPWESQGHYVDCVASQAWDLEAQGAITSNQRDTLIAEATERKCGS